MKEMSYDVEYSPLARLRAVADRALSKNNVPVEFPPELATWTEDENSLENGRNRIDLRSSPCLTIDCANTKDRDDAVGLRITDDGYELSVHIADVASYAPKGSPLDKSALERGTSIYLPHRTIPMFPAVLSDGLCSLKSKEDRRALSTIISLDPDGNVKDFQLVKSLIRVRVNGVYSEINALLEGSGDSVIKRKYAGLLESLHGMHDLAVKLRNARARKGANTTDRFYSIPVIEGSNICFAEEKSGVSEAIIEEFMVLANRLVAEYFKKNDLPAIYRVQKKRGQLASYAAVECHHAELALELYAHFTSPIRRLADLKIHQVLTAHLNGTTVASLWETFGEDMKHAAERATRCENRSDHVYRPCNDFCVGQFLAPMQNREFQADVVGHNCNNRPIFLLNRYHLRIIGKSGLHAYDGLRVSLKLAVTDDFKGTVEVQSFKRIGCATA